MLVTLVLTILTTASYIFYSTRLPDEPHGGTIPGMLYGIGGSALMLFAGLLSARKQVPTWRLGSAQVWLKGHIWLGLLSVPLILFHSGFQWGGLLERVLMWLFLLIVASGLVGLGLQQFLPRLMIKLVPMETIYEQIPHVCSVILMNADSMISQVCGPLGIEEPIAGPEEKAKKKARATDPVEGSGPLRDFYLNEVRPFLQKKDVTHLMLANPARAAAIFDQVRIILPQPLHAPLEQLATYCEERRQLALQARLHTWLHGWLFIHVPLSIALLILGIVHTVTALWY
jgi:hypothetical protein